MINYREMSEQIQILKNTLSENTYLKKKMILEVTEAESLKDMFVSSKVFRITFISNYFYGISLSI